MLTDANQTSARMIRAIAAFAHFGLFERPIRNLTREFAAMEELYLVPFDKRPNAVLWPLTVFRITELNGGKTTEPNEIRAVRHREAPARDAIRSHSNASYSAGPGISSTALSQWTDWKTADVRR
jgi:hypothetical protein